MGPLKVGTTLSQKYKIERLLAESGGVILYEATDTAHARRVWIKILQREALANEAALARFRREAGGSKVLDVGKSADGLPYMVATEFGPDKPPPPLKAGTSPKTTLRGVAPPAQVSETKPEPQLLDDEDVVSVRTPTPTVPLARTLREERFTSPLSATSDPPPVMRSPLLSTPPADFLADEEEPSEPEKPAAPAKPLESPALAKTIPPTRKKLPTSKTPTVLIEGRGRNQAPTAWTWVGAIIFVASLTGIAGWYLGNHEGRREGPAQPAASQSETPAEPTATEEPTAEPTQTAAAIATETKSAPPPPSATASAVASASPPATTESVKPPPPVHTVAPVHTTPPVHKPPQHTTSGDPLTL